jgi:long-chain fatty acid transport protein
MRNRRGKLCFLAVTLLLAWGTKGVAGGFRLADQDAFATARGEAFVATADNASAVYYNPAGISRLEGGDLRGGIYGIYDDISFQPLTSAANHGKTYHSQDHEAAVPQMFCSYTLENPKVGFGLGVYAPYGGQISWPDDTGFRTVGTSGSLTYYRLSPVVSWQVLPSLSVGAGAMVDYAELDIEQGLKASPAPLINYFRFKGEGWGAGYNAGILWQPHEMVSLGATFRSQTSLRLSDQTEFQDMPLIENKTQRAAWADYTFPLTVVGGLSFRPTPKWNLEFDADYTDWSSFGNVTLHQSSPPFPLNPTTDIPFKWQASWMYEFGVTRYFDHGWHASAGYVYSETSVPDAHYTPLAADLARDFFSVGAGKQFGKLSFDVVYQLGYGPPHTVRGSEPPSIAGVFAGQTADGTYEFISHAVMVTAGWRF